MQPERSNIRGRHWDDDRGMRELCKDHFFIYAGLKFGQECCTSDTDRFGDALSFQTDFERIAVQAAT